MSMVFNQDPRQFGAEGSTGSCTNAMIGSSFYFLVHICDQGFLCHWNVSLGLFGVSLGLIEIECSHVGT